jgi:hypothetical protein
MQIWLGKGRNAPKFLSIFQEWTAFLVDQSNKALERGETMIRWWTGPTKLAIWTLDSESSKVRLYNCFGIIDNLFK